MTDPDVLAEVIYQSMVTAIVETGEEMDEEELRDEIDSLLADEGPRIAFAQVYERGLSEGYQDGYQDGRREALGEE